MDTIKCEEVIISTLARRGKGVKYSPIRVITQVFTKDGELIAENDSLPETIELIVLSKEINRILNDNIEILPNSPFHEKLKTILNLIQ